MAQRQYRKPQPGEPLSQARSCYDHLAGVAGVTLSATLLDRGWIVPVTDHGGTHQPGYALTTSGREALTARGVTLPASERTQRRFAYACPDWTEPGAHIGGALGAAILGRLVEIGVVTRRPGDRTLLLSGNLEVWIGDAMSGSTPQLSREDWKSAS